MTTIHRQSGDGVTRHGEMSMRSGVPHSWKHLGYLAFASFRPGRHSAERLVVRSLRTRRLGPGA
jgi:hypothetical protein